MLQYGGFGEVEGRFEADFVDAGQSGQRGVGLQLLLGSGEGAAGNGLLGGFAVVVVDCADETCLGAFGGVEEFGLIVVGEGGFLGVFVVFGWEEFLGAVDVVGSSNIEIFDGSSAI
jgi:hypothetical protein